MKMSANYNNSNGNNSSERPVTDHMDTEELRKSTNELTAAAALTSLVVCSGNRGAVQAVALAATEADDEEETDHDDDEEGDDDKAFLIPQRFTKSGRKRAVPFPLKVRIIKERLGPYLLIGT
jgi:hypothetical protein